MISHQQRHFGTSPTLHFSGEASGPIQGKSSGEICGRGDQRINFQPPWKLVMIPASCPKCKINVDQRIPMVESDQIDQWTRRAKSCQCSVNSGLRNSFDSIDRLPHKIVINCIQLLLHTSYYSILNSSKTCYLSHPIRQRLHDTAACGPVGSTSPTDHGGLENKAICLIIEV